MKLNIIKLATGMFIAGVIVCSNGVITQAADLDTEIASAGISVLLDDYYSATTADEPQAEISAIIKETVQAVKEEHSIFANVAIAKVEDTGYVNVRKKASTEAKIVGKIYGNCGAYIQEEKDGWYKIESGNVTGWVKADYFVTGEDAKQDALDNGYVLATVNESGLHVRKKQSTDSKIISNIYLNETYAVTSYGKTDNWIKLAIDEGVEGWVSTDYIDVQLRLETAITLKEEKAIIAAQEAEAAAEAESESISASIAASEYAESVAESIAAANAAANNTTTYSYNSWTSLTTTAAATTTTASSNVSYDSSTGSSVVAYAKQFLGNPYVYGGSSLTNGTDCSGFTMSVYAHFGYYLSRTSSSQASNGTAVSLSSVQPGDLIFYTNGGSSIGHVAIYIGGGQIIHASSPSTGIIISNMYFQTPYCARRILN